MESWKCLDISWPPISPDPGSFIGWLHLQAWRCNLSRAPLLGFGNWRLLPLPIQLSPLSYSFLLKHVLNKLLSKQFLTQICLCEIPAEMACDLNWRIRVAYLCDPRIGPKWVTYLSWIRVLYFDLTWCWEKEQSIPVITACKDQSAWIPRHYLVAMWIGPAWEMKTGKQS